jgi:hypothetical protein
MTSQGLDFDSVRKRIDTMMILLDFLIEMNKIGSLEEINRVENETLPKLANMMMMLEFHGVVFRPELEFLCELERLYK